MGSQLKIDSNEAVALATELATLTGRTLDEAVLSALRLTVERERAAQGRLARMSAAADTFHALLGPNPPDLSHEWLYDEHTGLPR